MQPIAKSIFPICQEIDYSDEKTYRRCVDKYCAPFAKSGISITQHITNDMLPREFDRFLKKNNISVRALKHGAKYGTMPNGCTPLGHAAKLGNTILMKHIVNVGRKARLQLLNLADNYGRTPLHSAARCEDPKLAFHAVKILVDFGGNINFPTSRVYLLEHGGMGTAAFSTPLWTAIKTKNLPLIQLLILKGGIVYNPLTGDEKETVDEAMQIFFNHNKWLFKAAKDKSCRFNTLLPLEVFKLIFVNCIQLTPETLIRFGNKW